MTDWRCIDCGQVHLSPDCPPRWTAPKPDPVEGDWVDALWAQVQAGGDPPDANQAFDLLELVLKMRKEKKP